MFLATISSLAAVQPTVQNMGNHSNKKTLKGGGGRECFWAKNCSSGNSVFVTDSWEKTAVSSPWDYTRGRSPHQPPPRLPEETAHGSSSLASLLGNSELLPLTHRPSRVLALPHHLPPPPPLHTRRSHSIISTILKRKSEQNPHNKRLPTITDQVAKNTINAFWYLLCRFIVQVEFRTRVWCEYGCTPANPDYSQKPTEWTEQNLKLPHQRVTLMSAISQSSADAKTGKCELNRQHARRRRRPRWPLLWSRARPWVRCARGWSGRFQSLRRRWPPSLRPERQTVVFPASVKATFESLPAYNVAVSLKQQRSSSAQSHTGKRPSRVIRIVLPVYFQGLEVREHTVGTLIRNTATTQAQKYVRLTNSPFSGTARTEWKWIKN